MNTIKTLIEDYERRLKTVNDFLDTAKNSGSIADVQKFARLSTKASEFRTIIAELQRTTVDDSDCKTVLDVISLIPQQSQVQYDLVKQLQELRVAANKLGLYDAADFLRPKGE
ncbi:MAG: hypothetical protein EHM34_07215 [Nitrosopumilales archaeon]|nr:MAG: hypothetical protein EHM34_07215 [Nitrosopumilales archaeon]